MLLPKIPKVGQSTESTQNNSHAMKASNTNGKENTSSLETVIAQFQLLFQ
jgi:hypothetical protein